MPMTVMQPAATDLPDFIAGKLPEIAELCRRCGVRRLDLFGSAATRRFDPARSDLDFLVEFEDMPAQSYAKACFGLRDGLERLFQRQIDLLTQSALANPYLRRQIEAEKLSLFQHS